MRLFHSLFLPLFILALFSPSASLAFQNTKRLTVQSKAKPKVIKKSVKGTPKRSKAAKTSRPKKHAAGLAAKKNSAKAQTAKRASRKKQLKTASTPAKTLKAKARQSARAVRKNIAQRQTVFSPWEAPLQLSAKSYMVMDASTGATIFAKNPDVPRQPASTIKIVTGLLALKTLKNNDTVTASQYAASMPSSKVNIQPSKNYTANDMINAVLLASANDASVALAERIAGSESRFAQLMTFSAKQWGARNTVCRTASGLTAEGQQSTARDLAQLLRVAMQNQEFARRMHKRQASTAFGARLRNHNKALWRLDGALAGKTGYTNAARQTYVGLFKRGGHSIVVAIMGSETMWADLEKLVDYGFKQKNMAQASGKKLM